MGIAKHTLPMPTSRAGRSGVHPLLLHLICIHHQLQMQSLGETISRVTISVRSAQQSREIEELIACQIPDNVSLNFIVDAATNSGPATGLLAALTYDDSCEWLVTGCDYPLLRLSALQQLYESYILLPAAVTCFSNKDNFPEPLLAIWTPAALKLLRDLASEARRDDRKIGPMQAIRRLQRQDGQVHLNLLTPANPTWLTNVNTIDDWTSIQDQLQPA